MPAENEVTRLVAQLGGLLHAAAVAQVAPETMHLAMRKGRLQKSDACVRVARALAPSDPAAQMAIVVRLAGIPD